jgi:hypothetical protein
VEIGLTHYPKFCQLDFRIEASEYSRVDNPPHRIWNTPNCNYLSSSPCCLPISAKPYVPRQS